ncbi:MAG: haloacid dehalogenase-like hydrolase [Oscillospiraceae bacterium]|jgi:phosphoserine phosphatase|nr:haloacid dehalogenase-like hydrolase [Oscillospiraceae bacterium]
MPDQIERKLSGLNVFDFDNTLYEGESGIDLFFFYLKKRPSLIRFAPVVLIGVIKYKLHKVQLTDAVQRYAGIISIFLRGVKDFDADAKEFWDKHAHKLRSFYQTLHREDDLVISASPEQSLKEVCGRLGIKRWIGTRVNEETHALEFICFRENKVRAFLERYPGERIENFYTDSMNDKPLMDLAEHVFFVRRDGMEQIK